MDFEASSLRTEEQFWNELDDVLKRQCDSHEEIDDSLRTYLSLLESCRDDFFDLDHDITRCTELVLSSPLFTKNADYIRLQIIYSLLQEDSHDNLLGIVSFLLFDGCENETTFEMMCEEGAFCRLLELIQSLKGDDHSGSSIEASLHRLLMDLLYEMSRIQRVKIEDLVTVDDEFIKYLLQIIEEPPEEPNDPYHYAVIRVLLVLNEQFMVSSHDPTGDRTTTVPLTNKVMKVLSMHGSLYKTFGENIILLLNREGTFSASTPETPSYANHMEIDETSLQLLTLKILYLLFTTPSTYEYFYTNDLRVLVDILIRNLYDLPEDAMPLRHTYLRVLYPLLAHTQLKYPPHDRREELRKLFTTLIRGQWSDTEDGDNSERILHFNEVDDTTKRLVLRCAQVDWICEGTNWFAKELSEPVSIENSRTNGHSNTDSLGSVEAPSIGSPISPQTSLDENLHGHDTSSSPIQHPATASAAPGFESARSSSHSIAKVASHKERPGVIVPSKGAAKQKPEPPVARRSRARRRAESKEKDEKGSTSRGCRGFSESGISKLHPAELENAADNATSASSPVRKPEDNTSCSSPREPVVQSPDPITPASSYCFPPSSASHKTHIHHPTTPPAVPPPRRSSQSVPPPHPVKSHSHHHTRQQHSATRPPPPPPHNPHNCPPSRPSQKPEPPRTRRWRAHQHHQKHEDSNGHVTPDAQICTPSPTEANHSLHPSQQQTSHTNGGTESPATPIITVEMVENKLSEQMQKSHVT
ncbi:hypothetical protein MGYG_00394 [Nannizzia gypsea CBS 118893]|uniref:SPIN90/Ldb17 leucine-rich domain-containing protein n=1 Tax=Arthroderma gypseum (strain ATCC MYA-4604 / CBS 118893) TaxID=535722 RepID=E5QZI9_ARTGP|nr:hypothetical protein MGYG_00394 [Nannizzia gypsea CBS 118893]EFQ97355.1 hypothetical protein MGYG_00394 [Nannizzia gypsea CBS 118893]